MLFLPSGSSVLQLEAAAASHWARQGKVFHHTPRELVTEVSGAGWQRWGQDPTCQLSPTHRPTIGCAGVSLRGALMTQPFPTTGQIPGLLGHFCPDPAHPSVTLYLLTSELGAENHRRKVCLWGAPLVMGVTQSLPLGNHSPKGNWLRGLREL